MESHDRFSILLGGVGGDSHSVGLTILRHALLANGYSVRFLGTQNPVDTFFQLAPLYDVVMISTLDGHARYYLQDFPELAQQYRVAGYSTLWYLGGNLHVGDSAVSDDDNVSRHFLNMGFSRVFTKFTDIQIVIDTLRMDLSSLEPKPKSDSHDDDVLTHRLYRTDAVEDGVYPHDRLLEARAKVLSQWRTGRAALDLHENAAFLGSQPSFAATQAQVTTHARSTLIQPRVGVPSPNEQLRMFAALKRAGIAVLSYQIDSLTRVGDYKSAEDAMRESDANSANTLNGFPLINVGVPSLRKIIRSVKLPLQCRHSARDPRLLAEISYAGGVTSFEGGCVCYNIPYYRDLHLSESIDVWKYVDRLTALYHEQFGIVIDREFFGVLTGTLVPPCIAITIDVLESILAVQQGVKSVSVGYAEQGNRVQDIAAMHVLKEVTEETLQNFGFKDIQVSTVFHQYMAAFPEDGQRAMELIMNSAATGVMSAATRMMTKTAVEAIRIPSLADNLRAIDEVRAGIVAASSLTVNQEELAQEVQMIRREVDGILNSVLFCGGGNVAKGIITGFEKGYLDVPFSPSIYNKGLALTARDVNGAVRFISFGNLQVDSEVRDYHRERISERRLSDGVTRENENYMLVETDILQIPRGNYDRWPLNG